jgi:hypothetical protein
VTASSGQAARRGKLFTPNLLNVAVDADLYGGGVTGQDREELFGRIEAAWP